MPWLFLAGKVTVDFCSFRWTGGFCVFFVDVKGSILSSQGLARQNKKRNGKECLWLNSNI